MSPLQIVLRVNQASQTALLVVGMSLQLLAKQPLNVPWMGILVVRTPGFHAVDPSLNPGTSTIWGHVQSSEIPVSAWLTLKIHSKSVK